MLKQLMQLLCALMLAAIPVTAASAQAQPSGEKPYVLGTGDVIEVEVLGQSDFGKARVRVQSDGTVPLPMIGTVPASGRTVSQLTALVQQKLVQAQLYTNPSVNIDIVSYASRYVIVLGAVAQPGLVPIDRPYRVSEVLARVGGVKDTSSDHVILTSPTGAQRQIAIETLAQSGPANDPYVNPDDKLFIPNAEQFYIYGQVNAPGAYPLKDGMTLRQALARGGGLTASGSEKRLTLYRKEQKLKLPLDAPLQPGDVVVIGERLF